MWSDKLKAQNWHLCGWGKKVTHITKLRQCLTIKIHDGRNDIFFSQMDCINMGHRRFGIYTILVKITWLYPYMEMKLEKVVIKVIIWGKELTKKHFSNGRVRSSEKLLLNKSKANTGKNCQNQLLQKSCKLTKGLRQSKGLLFNKSGWISVRLVSFEAVLLAYYSPCPHTFLFNL